MLIFVLKAKMINSSPFSTSFLRPTSKNVKTEAYSRANRASWMLAKTRYYVPSFLLRILSFAIFESYLRYACQIWGKLKTKKANDIVLFQGKATRITNFENKYTSLKSKTKIKTFAN